MPKHDLRLFALPEILKSLTNSDQLSLISHHFSPDSDRLSPISDKLSPFLATRP
jgi:hypothetical protein